MDPISDYGQRIDGTPKGRGWWGEMSDPEGWTVTELSTDYQDNGQRVLAPLLNPLLTREEIKHLVSGGDATQSILQKTHAWVDYRRSRGQGPFAGPSEGRSNPRSPLDPLLD